MKKPFLHTYIICINLFNFLIKDTVFYIESQERPLLSYKQRRGIPDLCHWTAAAGFTCTRATTQTEKEESLGTLYFATCFGRKSDTQPAVDGTGKSPLWNKKGGRRAEGETFRAGGQRQKNSPARVFSDLFYPIRSAALQT